MERERTAEIAMTRQQPCACQNTMDCVVVTLANRYIHSRGKSRIDKLLWGAGKEEV